MKNENGIEKSAILTGQTLVNLANTDDFIAEGLLYTSNLSVVSNKIYTVYAMVDGGKKINQEKEIVFRIKENDNSGNDLISPKQIAPNDTTTTLKICEKIEIEAINNLHIRFYNSKPQNLKLMIIEGDYTNVDIPYFEGMKSVQMPVLTTSNEDGTKTNILTVNELVELRGIGDVQDELNLLTGELTQRVGEIVLDGSEDWIAEDARFRLYRDDIVPNKWSNGLSNHFIGNRGQLMTGVDYDNYFAINGYGSHLYVRDIDLFPTPKTQINEFKTWLNERNIQGNPVILQYISATESIKTVDLTIQDQDNQPQDRMKLFPSGYINTSSSTFPPILQLKGITHNNKLNMTTTNGTNNTQLATLDNLVLDGIICRDGTVVRDSYDVESGLYTKRVFRFTIDEEFVERYRGKWVFSSNTVCFEYALGQVFTGIPKSFNSAKGIANNATYNISGDVNRVCVNADGALYVRLLKEELKSYDVDGLLEWIRRNGAIEIAYQMATPQIIHMQPNMTPYVSTRPYQGSIESQGNILESSFLDYTSEQSIISPKPLGDGDVLRWEQGSQCYVYENDKEYIPLTDYNQPMGTVLDLEEEDGEQYVENLDGGDIIVDVPFKEKAVYERHLVSHEDNVIYPTQDKLDPTGKIEVDYICGETWQNPNDLADIRHVGTLRDDGQYDVTIRRSGDDEIRLMDGTTHLSLDGDGLNPSEFELTFLNSGGVEVGKYGDTSHTLEDCVLDSKLETGTVYGDTLVNLVQMNGLVFEKNMDGTAINPEHKLAQEIKPSTKYIRIVYVSDLINNSGKQVNTYDNIGGNQYAMYNIKNGVNIQAFTTKEDIAVESLKDKYSFNIDTTLNKMVSMKCKAVLLEYQQGMENWDIPYFEGVGSTIVNGFTTVGKNLIGGTTKGKMEDNGLIVEWDNGIVTVNGCKTLDDSYLYFRDKRMDAYCITDGKYSMSYKIISGEIDSSNCRLGNNICTLTLTDGTNIHGLSIYENSIIGKNENRTFTRNLKDNMNNCWFRIHNGAKFNNFKIQFQLEKGSVATEFEECKLTQYTLPTPITLNKVGDVADTFDVVSGVETRNVMKVVLDGSELNKYATYDLSNEYPDIIGGYYHIGNSGFNEYLPPFINTEGIRQFDVDILPGYLQTNEEGIVVNGSFVKFAIKRSKLASLDTQGIRQYFSENPITLYIGGVKTSITIQHTLIPSTVETMQEPTFILPQPLRSVPNGICDRLYWDENKGYYCIEKRIERFTIDGSYSWSQEGSNDTFIGFYGAINVGSLSYGASSIILSDFAKYYYGSNSITGEEKLTNVGNGYLKIFIRKDRLTEPTPNGFKLYLRDNPITLYHALNSNATTIIDLPHLNKKLTLPTHPNTLPIGYKVEYPKANPQLGLTIPYKQLNYPSRPQNIDFKMDIADYVLTWDDVKEARQYNVILNDRTIATVKEPQWNSGEEMYGYIMVEAQNELAENLSEELYIKTVPNAPAQLTVAHNPMTDYYDFEISFIKTSAIAEYYTVQYRIDGGEWVYKTIQSSEIDPNSKVLWRFSVYEISEQIEVWATATNDIGTNDILPTAIYYMSPTPQWTYKINSKELFVRWMDDSPYDVQYKLRYQYKSDGIYRYAYFEGDKQEIGKLYEALIPLADDEEVSIALCIISEKENLYTKPIKASKELDPNIKPPKNFNYHWLARGLIEFYWEDNYDVDVEYEAIVEHRLTSGNNEWITDTRIFSATDTEGTGAVYRLEYQLEDLEEIRVKVRMRWAMNETEWSESLTTVFIPVEGNPPQWIRRTQTQEGLLVEWEAQEYVDSYHVYVMSNGEELQHLETMDNFIYVDLDYSNPIDIEIYEATRFSGGIQSDPTDKMRFRPTMDKHQLIHDVVTPDTLTYEIEVDTVQKGIKERQVIHDINTTPKVTSKQPMDVAIKSPFTLSFHPLQLDVHQAGSKYYGDTELHIKTLDVKSRDSIEVLTFERITDQYGVDFTVYTPSASKYPITLEVNRVRIVCFGDSLTSGHPGFWE